MKVKGVQKYDEKNMRRKGYNLGRRADRAGLHQKRATGISNEVCEHRPGFVT